MVCFGGSELGGARAHKQEVNENIALFFLFIYFRVRFLRGYYHYCVADRGVSKGVCIYVLSC